MEALQNKGLFCSASYALLPIACMEPGRTADCASPRIRITVFYGMVLPAAWVSSVGVKGWIEGVEVSFVQVILDDAEGFAETLEVHDFSGPQEPDGVGYIRRIHGQTQDVVVSSFGFFFCCHILRQIRNRISNRLEHCC